MSDLKFNVTEIKENTSGAYSASRYLYDSYKVNRSKIIASEGIEFEPDADKRGGIITFSTEVNALDLSENKVINYLKKKFSPIKNRLYKNKKIDKIANEHGLVGWTVGHFLSGRYTAKNGKVFDENSISVEIIGISTDELI